MADWLVKHRSWEGSVAEILDPDEIALRRKRIRYNVVFGSGVWRKVANGGDKSITIFVLQGGFWVGK